MKNIALSVLAAFVLMGTAFAGAMSVTTNATATMIVPPAVNFGGGPGYAMIADRGATNTAGTVLQGEYRRINGAIAVSANAGTVSGELVTNTTVVAGGTFYGTNVVTGLIVTNVIAATTNTVITRASVAIPLTGLSAVDGTVYWLRVPATRNPVIVQARIPLEGASVTITDSNGGIVALHEDYDRETFTGGRALFARADGTNTCTVTVIEQ
jgi:hypothetical protein